MKKDLKLAKDFIKLAEKAKEEPEKKRRIRKIEKEFRPFTIKPKYRKKKITT